MTINIDEDPVNRDWTRQRWDLPARNVRELRAYLREHGMTVEQFKQMPVYTLNVTKLRWLKRL
ncbi:MAG: hypothetical protein ACREL7_16910 [Longimicrobiales bacterium]